MALANNIDWEIRSTATASNVNGGGFVRGASGTDYSQQDAAQYALTGVTSAGAGNTILTASAASDMVGNMIRVVSGTNFTTGWFEITSVSVGVSITCSTNNAGTAISVGVGSNGVMNIGGALSLGSSDDAVFENGTPGSIFHVKQGTYTLGGAVSISAAGTAALPIRIEGYASARSDKPRGSTRPTFNQGTSRFNLGVGWHTQSMIFTSSSTSGTILGANAVRMVDCKIFNTSTTSTATAVATCNFLYRCELSSLRGVAFQTSGNPTLINCYLHDSDVLFNTTSVNNFCTITGCIFEGAVTYAVQLQAVSTSGMAVIHGNTFYGSEAKRGVAIFIPTGGSFIQIINNTISGFVTGISHADVQTHGYDDYNNFYNNTTDVTNWTKGPNDTANNPSFTSVTQITGTTAITSGGTLVDSGANFSTVTDNRDFVHVISGTGVTVGKYLITSHTTTALTTSPALSNDATADKVYSVGLGHDFRVGTAMIANGYPDDFPGGLTTAYVEQGAVQRGEDYPADSEVALGVTFANGSRTGTRRQPTIATVQTGVVYGPSDSLTGTYTGSDRWSDPGIANVRLGTAYKADSTTNNRTGTCNVPTAPTVLKDVPTDATVGTLEFKVPSVIISV